MRENIRVSSSWINFQRALRNLENSVKAPIREPRDVSGIIKDFEMTYELSWKVLKKTLRDEGHETLGAKDVYTKAFQLGYLDAQDAWLSMIQDRNQAAHVYDEKDALELVKRIQALYLHAFQTLEVKLVAIISGSY